jgi:hypothetical protein
MNVQHTRRLIVMSLSLLSNCNIIHAAVAAAIRNARTIYVFIY